ncbi:T-cell receptor alpha chain V region PHDS58 [Acipenser ruthenus]|nr:T-cell receptor alpha chain V region PHDS58 [Acipenser ruthenus]
MTQADSVTQHFKSIVVKETHNSTIHCQYETASSPTLFWYIQDPNQAPQLILGEFTQNDNIPLRFRNRFSVSHDKKNENKTFPLNIIAAMLSDSATYFCALSPTL